MSFFQQVQALFYPYNNTNNNKPVKSSTLEQMNIENIANKIVEQDIFIDKDLPIYTGLECFQLLSCLGDGAFSIVYKALNKNTLQQVAIKVIRKSDINPTQKSSVLKEVQLMRNFDHESIISLYEFIETKEYYFLVMELCEGGELFHQIVHLTYFSEDLAKHCISQVAEGIRYLHNVKGVIHRDIKPENLLYKPIKFMKRNGPTPILQPEDEDEPKIDEGEFIEGIGGGCIGKVKIADFGLSKVVIEENNHQARTPCGTIGYTAPEIVSDQYYTKSVDMWALGCVLYTMLCGFPPFYDDDVEILTEKVANGQYEFLSPWWDYISDDAKDLVSHLLCVNPKQRYDIDQFLSHPWLTKKAFTNEEPCKIIGDVLLPSTTTTSVAKENIAASKPQYIPSDKRKSNDLLTTATNITTLKDIIDVSYDLLRRSEEQSFRKEKFKQPRFFSGYFSNHDTEDDETDDDYEDEFSDITSRCDTNTANSPSITKLQFNNLSMSFNHQLHLNDTIIPSSSSSSSSSSPSSPSFLQHQQKSDMLPNLNNTASINLEVPNIKNMEHDHLHSHSAATATTTPFELKMNDSALINRRKQSTNLKTILPLVRSS
ncbi:unnamed protein product [Cunninghamella blakesleeana]